MGEVCDLVDGSPGFPHFSGYGAHPHVVMAGLVQAIHAELSFYLCGFKCPHQFPFRINWVFYWRRGSPFGRTRFFIPKLAFFLVVFIIVPRDTSS